MAAAAAASGEKRARPSALIAPPAVLAGIPVAAQNLIVSAAALMGVAANHRVRMSAFSILPHVPRRRRFTASEVVDSYDEDAFRARFRVSKHLFDFLVSNICTHPCFRRVKHPVAYQLLIALFHLGQGVASTLVADRFQVSCSMVRAATLRCADAVSACLGDEVHWPSGRSECREVAKGFEALCGLPTVLGAVDGSLIPIHFSKKMRFKHMYDSRKGFPATVLQAACDSSGRFIAIDAGWAGNLNDAYIFHRTWGSVLEQLVPRGYVLLADGAYPLSPLVMKPYGSLQRPQQHMRFNFLLSRGRGRVEIAFGHLKNTWRVLSKAGFEVRDPSEHTRLVTCCCVLHNLLVTKDGHSFGAAPSPASDTRVRAWERVVMGALAAFAAEQMESDDEGAATDVSTTATAAGAVPTIHPYATNTSAARAALRLKGEAMRALLNTKAEAIMVARPELYAAFAKHYGARYRATMRRVSATAVGGPGAN